MFKNMLHLPFERIKFKTELWGAITASFIVNIGLWIYVSIAFKNVSDIVPLHYSIYFGVDLIGSKIKLFFLPLTALIFLIADIFIAYFLEKKDQFVSMLIIIVGACLQIAAFIASIPIIQNIR